MRSDMRSLAGSFDRDLPGLPRGRARLSVDDVRDAQRKRILRAVISSVAAKGLAATTVADIVARARVSRQAFYHQFDGKEQCLIAAVDSGIDVIVSTIADTWASVVDAPAREQLRRVVGDYLELCASEPEFVRAWVIDLPAAGLAGLAKRNEYVALLADKLSAAYAAISHDPPSDQVFLAAIGGCYELVYQHTAQGGAASYSHLHAPMVSFLERVLPLHG